MSVKMPVPAARLYLDSNMRTVARLDSDELVAWKTNLFTTEQAQAYAQAVRDEAPDKAADLVGGSSMTSRHAAAAIRALKEQP